MTKYIIQRILAMLVTLFIIVTIGFMVIRLMPGGIFDDAVDMTYEQREALEAKYNLDKPIPVQYALFLKGLVLEGDWGTSLKMYVNVPVWEVIKTKIPVTLYINFFSLIISLPLGIILGIVAAVRKNTMTDYLISFLVVIFISVPSFIFATLLQYFVAFKAPQPKGSRKPEKRRFKRYGCFASAVCTGGSNPSMDCFIKRESDKSFRIKTKK